MRVYGHAPIDRLNKTRVDGISKQREFTRRRRALKPGIQFRFRRTIIYDYQFEFCGLWIRQNALDAGTCLPQSGIDGHNYVDRKITGVQLTGVCRYSAHRLALTWITSA